MYVLVRGDLTPGSQIAQAIHAAVEYTLEHPARVVPTVVALEVDSEEQLLEHAHAFGVLFREPDLGGEATAFCAVSDGREFSRLRLAGAAMA